MIEADAERATAEQHSLPNVFFPFLLFSGTFMVQPKPTHPNLTFVDVTDGTHLNITEKEKISVIKQPIMAFDVIGITPKRLDIYWTVIFS